MDAHQRTRLLDHLAALSSPTDCDSNYRADHDADFRILRELRKTVDQILELSPPCSPHPPATLTNDMDGGSGVRVQRITTTTRTNTPASSVRGLSPPSSPEPRRAENRIIERWQDEERLMENGKDERESLGFEDANTGDSEVDEADEDEEPPVDPERRFQRLSEILANLQAQAEAAVNACESGDEKEYDEGEYDSEYESGEYSEFEEEEDVQLRRVEADGAGDQQHQDEAEANDMDHSKETKGSEGFWQSLPPRPETRLEMRSNDAPAPESDQESEAEPEIERIRNTPHTQASRILSPPPTSCSSSSKRRVQYGPQDAHSAIQFSQGSRPLTPPSSTTAQIKRRRSRRRSPRAPLCSNGGESDQLKEKVHEAGITGTMDVLPVSGDDEIERLLVELLRTGETEVLMFRVVWMWMGSLGLVWLMVGWALGWGRCACGV